ncbi:MAG: Hsp70 family protein [Phycisphaerae bacterium]|nr:Hsp70 family protein [Phycisphaerae bacterium]NUQ08048.1 Hsp70 family protein [Phycisphaerae bacterium]
MIVMGIDFGTTQSKMAVMDEFGRAKSIRNVEGDEITPTVVAFENGETPIVGIEAYRLALSQPEHTRMDFKLKLGADEVLYTTKSGKKHTATTLSSLVLAKLKCDAESALGESIHAVVLTCPANFQDHQRQALLDAAKLAGLEVRRLVPEPSAAAMAYGLQRSDQTFFVFDLGGGTFDATVARIQGAKLDVLGTSGLPNVGGRNFDQILMERLLHEFEGKAGFAPDRSQDLAFFEDARERTEQAKVTLATREKTTVTLGARGKYASIEVTRDTFLRLTASLVEQAASACNDLLQLVGLSWSRIDKLLFVGGGSRAVGVKEAMEKASGQRVSQDIDPIRAVAFGAAIQGAIEAGGFVLDGRAIPAPKLHLTDVTAYAIGCMVDDVHLGFSNAVIVPRHSRVPSRLTKTFKLKEPQQTHAEIVLLQGNEGDPADQCLRLGQMELSDLPAEPTMPPRIEVTLDFDKNGICSAFGKDTLSGKSTQMRIDYSKGLVGVHRN